MKYLIILFMSFPAFADTDKVGLLGVFSTKAPGATEMVPIKKTSPDEKPSWFCGEEAGMRNDNIISACGVGEGINETVARGFALQEAFNEFRMVCENSSDCKGHQILTSQKRQTCFVTQNGHWKCHRLIEVTIGPLQVQAGT